MTFLAPALLWLTPLVLSPVAFHLFFRVRSQPRIFPSLMFFLQADPRLSARRRLREWLLLALRCLTLLALLLALARPTQQGRGGGGVALAAVIDNSASMRASGPGGQTRLSRALAAAQALLGDADVALAGLDTTVRDPLAAPPPGLTSERAAVRAALAAIRPTDAAGEPVRALSACASAVRGTMRDAGEVHVFTDLQAAEWGRSAAAFEFPAGVSLVVHDVAGDDDAAGAVALEEVVMPARPLLAGRGWPLRLRLRNAGERDADVAVNVLAEGAGERQRLTATVPAGQMRPVEVTMKAGTVGRLAVHVRVEGGAAAPGAEAWLGTVVSEGARAWLLGATDDHGLLAAALAPAGSATLTGFRVEGLPLSRLAGTVGTGNADSREWLAVTAAQLAQADVAEACRRHVLAGGVLLVAPGPTWPVPAAALPAWCGAQWEEALQAPEGRPWMVFDLGASLWDELRDSRGEPLWRGVRVTRAVSLRPLAPGGHALAGLDDGTALLVRSAVGEGAVVVCGVAWDPTWSNLPHKAAFLGLAHGMALESMRTASAVRVAGAPLEAVTPPPAATASDGEATTQPGPIRVKAVAGAIGDWTEDAARPRVPVRVGVYEWLDPRGGTRLLSVRGDPAEADPRRVKGDTIPLLASVPHRVVRDADATAAAAAAAAARHGRSLFAPLLLLAVAAAVGEAWLAGGVVRPRGARPVAGKEGART